MSDPATNPFTLAGVFLVGLGLNLTPCVYPMLSVTVSLFGASKKTQSRVEAFMRALVYVLGISTMFTALGVAAALTGSLFGSALQNRWMLLAISAMLLALAGGMFGLYVFQMPSWMLQKAGSRKFTGLAGIFLAGILVGVFAAPCIGPPIAAVLLWVGTTGDPLLAFRTFFVMSAGLGLPYLIFGTFSNLLARLPRSGMWLVWIEKFFGVLLAGLALFYFILAVKPSLLKGLRPAASPAWEAYSPEKLEAAKKNHEPAILDFYADWCVPCHELDQFTYSDKRVMQALEGYAKFKVDVTDAEMPSAEEAIKRFEVFGVPTILFLDRGGREVEESRTTGFVSAEEFLKLLPESSESSHEKN